jgi:hypothetical protein
MIRHCKHYCGRGLMKNFKSGAELAKEMGISTAELKATFDKYNAGAKNKSDEFGKKFFHNVSVTRETSLTQEEGRAAAAGCQ